MSALQDTGKISTIPDVGNNGIISDRVAKDDLMYFKY